MIDCPVFSIPPYTTPIISASVGSHGLSADNYGNAVRFTVPFTTVVDKVAFVIATTTLAGDLTVQIETVVPSTFLPTGTLYHANAYGTYSALTTDDGVWVEVTLAAPVTLTEGDNIAITVQRLAGSTFTGTLRRLVSWPLEWPGYTERSGGAWSGVSSRWTPITIHSTTAGWINNLGNHAVSSSASESVSSASSPDEVGMKFTPRITARLTGVLNNVGSINAGDAYDLKIYDAANTVLWSKSFTYGTDWPSGIALAIQAVTPRLTLRAGQVYRITQTPTNGTLGFPYSTFYSGSVAASFGAGFEWTERTDAGAWTELDNRSPEMYLIFDGIEQGATESTFTS